MNAKYSIAAVIAVIIIVAGVAIIHHSGSKSNGARSAAVPNGTISYLPLGDSYTIGQSVAEAGRWPNQLVQKYASTGTKIQIVANPSVTGYTTQNLIDTELPLVPKLKPNFVSVLIGVNDYVQGVSIDTFQTNLNQILTTLQSEMAKPDNILLVTIPDYAKTPTGATFGDPTVATAAIRAFNTVIEQTAAKYQLPVADIFPVSQQVANDPSLIANDGLHPSGKEYAAWTTVIYRALQASSIKFSK